MNPKLKRLTEQYNAACDELETRSQEWDDLADDASDEDATEARDALTAATDAADQAKQALEAEEARQRAREQHKRVALPDPEETPEGGVEVDEPDMYVKGGRSFLHDLYMSQLRDDPGARERIGRHHNRELEKRAVATATLGGIIPPQYLLELVAKASRNGRVFADQVNSQPLPDQGMSLIVPRLTQGLAAGAQATESSAVTTQDPTESDLTVNVRTISGYSPVSRQTLERAAYSDAILFEDLLARYWAAIDSQALNGGGGSGTLLGLLQTSSIATSTASTATVAGVWPKVADVIQQINTNTGGLGYVATKIVMHPRRWGFFEAALDSQNRPVFGIGGQPAFNVVGGGDGAGYGPVGFMHGLPVYTDANIPTNLGTNTNEDRIIVFADPVVHLWERENDPVTLSFEQQAGTSLQVQLIAYGYVAFTAGRYPGASGAVTGAGLVPPSF